MKKVIYILLFPIFALLLFFVSSSYSQSCGPGPHWVDDCAAGTDTIDCDPSPYVEIEIEQPQNQCNGPFSIVTAAEVTPTIVRRSAPNSNGCTPPGHLCRMETEIVQLQLTGTSGPNAVKVTVGAGQGIGPLGSFLDSSKGTIIELPGDSLLAESCFDVFFEICIIGELFPPPGPDTIYLYNHQPHRICAIIDRVPPLCNTIYEPPLPPPCLGLFTDPRPGFGQKFANMRRAVHILPVELSSFTSIVNERNITLNWTTASEENNSGFEIERSKVNGQWSIIGYLNGQGNSNIAHNYSFEDRNLSSGRYNYRLKQIDYNGNFQYFDLQNEVVIGTPEKFSLHQNYPNPFNPTTKINYDIPKEGIVKLTIFDNNGREMKTLVNEFRTAGYYTTDFNALNLSSGVYYYKLQSNNFVATKKMVILK